MDHFDFSSHDALLDFTADYNPLDPQRSHSYSSSHGHSQLHHQTIWPPMTFEDMENESLSQQQRQQQRQQQQHIHLQQQSQQQQQQQQQQPHSNPYSASSNQHIQQVPQQSSSSSLTSQQQHARPRSNHSNHSVHLQASTLDLEYAGMLNNDWQFQLQQAAQQQRAQQFVAENTGLNMNAFNTPPFVGQLQASPIDFMPNTAAETFAVSAAMDSSSFMTMAGPMDSMNALVWPLNDYQSNNFTAMALNQHTMNQHASESVHSSIHGGSPTGTILEVQSLSDNEWSMVNYNPHRQSIDSFTGTVSNPSQNLHIRTSSDLSVSDDPSSAELSGSFEEIPPWPLSSPHDFHGSDYLDAQYIHQHGLPAPSRPQHSPSSSLEMSPSGAVSYRSSGSSSTSPVSSGPTSPPTRRRKSPVDGKTTKAVIKKTSASGSRKDGTVEKKVGRRRGPLRPDQRQQAHEIRKLRACLRCKFLKKTCDKGEPCGGCRPSHARLWQVPCTRLDIKDIGYFMKDWKADYERHVSLGFSVGNIKGFSTLERTLYITHGFGHYLPINAREVYVHDDRCFELDWTESDHETPIEFQISTAKLSAGMEGVSVSLLSDYLDLHLEQNFESFVSDFFEGTKFLTEMLLTAHRYYLKEKTPSIRKALKLVLAYNLTQHVTMVEGLSDEENFTGKIDDSDSKFFGKTFAPVMINFQIKCALADMWRELQKDILEELSALYSSVYSGDKLKNWPTIFMLATVLLAIWEEMQFDCHYRVPDEKVVNKFCEDMETTPVGVIVGLFQAISTKLPGLAEWDTSKHHQLLNSNVAVCEALTEVRGHVNKHEDYLKDRAKNSKFDRDDFDSLSNKFLSKLVIRAN
ncbi:Hypothetical protein R9X50_00034600 [Acrodontium crateriforme]|uniref:C6 finger domain-containing protein n=1 Tax=Acrodontium crateriforme TaxID=150365 RepID=A0AAQ3R712_9PEZI|nr:Hypothetical protein R9X50_00034600 [Acrodontium crateriforme]